jgi:hypothetical protein
MSMVTVMVIHMMIIITTMKLHILIRILNTQELLIKELIYNNYKNALSFSIRKRRFFVVAA